MEGVSLRYSAIVLLGARYLPEQDQRRIFGGQLAVEFSERLIDALTDTDNLGDVALITWAAAELRQPELRRALEHLDKMWARAGNEFTVESAWVLSAYAAASIVFDTRERAAGVFKRLKTAFSEEAALFSHWLEPDRAPWLRSHVACFADQIYPTQAFSRYHQAFDVSEALFMADRCAERICSLQGDAGQWWWHYDVRTGAVIEGYPVYSVHQDSMGPMALFDLMEAGGKDRREEIRRGLVWMDCAQEVGCSLVDESEAVIWRKVARNEPGKLSRGVRTLATRFHPDLRLSWLDSLLPSTWIDWESRPYHLGWVLHAWLGGLDS